MRRIYILLILVVLNSCATSRALVHWSPTVDDRRFFQTVEILPSPETFNFANGDSGQLNDYMVNPAYYGIYGDETSLENFLATTDDTRAFIIIRNDSVLYEKYYHGFGPQDISGVFSVTKSIVALLTGIAVDEGYIRSIDDPVTDYLPHLSKKDNNFRELTIAHLLDMKGGFKFNEDSRSPFSKSAGFYYGNKLEKRAGRLKFQHDPGDWFEYQSAQTAVLGLAVENAIGKNLGEYLAEKVWTHLGMQNPAEWAIDDTRNNAAKGHCGLYLSAIDLAKIGRLYLNGGEWNGQRIVSQQWIDGTFVDGLLYSRCWWRPEIWFRNPDSEDSYFDSEEQAKTAAKEYSDTYPGTTYSTVWPHDNKPGRWGAYVYHDCFVARGIYQQILYIDPLKNIIAVRLGKNASIDYSTFINDIIKVL